MHKISKLIDEICEEKLNTLDIIPFSELQNCLDVLEESALKIRRKLIELSSENEPMISKNTPGNITELTGISACFDKTNEILQITIPFPIRRNKSVSSRDFARKVSILLPELVGYEEDLSSIFKGKCLIHTRFCMGTLNKNGTKYKGKYPDHDNFPEIKSVQDRVCEWLGRDDNISVTTNYYDAVLSDSPRSKSEIIINIVSENASASYFLGEILR